MVTSTLPVEVSYACVGLYVPPVKNRQEVIAGIASALESLAGGVSVTINGGDDDFIAQQGGHCVFKFSTPEEAGRIDGIVEELKRRELSFLSGVWYVGSPAGKT